MWIPASDRARLEQLCRYLLRPPLGQDRVRLRPDGRVLVELKKAWRDGTSHLLFEPLEFLEKLAAITPRPRVNLLLYHGVLAPHARWRRHVAAYGRAVLADPRVGAADAIAPSEPGARRHSRYWAWAELMRRAFEIDVLGCPRCGGRLRLIASIVDPAVVHPILAHLGLLHAGPGPPERAAIAPTGPWAGPTP